MADENKGAKRVHDHAGTEQKGLMQDVIVPVLQEAKPILEGTAVGLAVHKITGGKNPQPPSGKDKG